MENYHTFNSQKKHKIPMGELLGTCCKNFMKKLL